MCEKKSYCNREIDTCIQKTVERINRLTPFKTIACCCGHGKYPTTIVIKNRQGKVFELLTRLPLEKQKRNRYYKSDKEGIYFIPRVEQLKETISYLECFYEEIEVIISEFNCSDRQKLEFAEEALKDYKNTIMRDQYGS